MTRGLRFFGSDFSWKTVLKCLLLLLGCICLGFLLILFSYLMPTDRIHSNLLESEDFFEEGVTYPELISGYPDTRLDQFTDCLMLLTAAAKTEDSLPFQAMNNARYSIGDTDPEETFVEIFHEGSANYKADNGYGRYWHGYLVFLKPLLTLFNYKQILTLNLMLQLSLILALGVVYGKRGNLRCILPFAAVCFFINPLAVILSIQYSGVWIITLSALLILALKNELSGEKLAAFFLIVGCVTSFMDLFTFPTITLGIPLAYCILSGQSSLRDLFRRVIISGLSWGTGYGGMWAGKWIVGGLITRKNLLRNAMQAASTRRGYTSELGNSIHYRNVLLRLYYTCNGTVIKMILLISVVITLCLLLRKARPDPVRMSGLFVVCLIPFLWFAFVANHSFVHYWFTYRTLASTVYAAVAILTAAWVSTDRRTLSPIEKGSNNL